VGVSRSPGAPWWVVDERGLAFKLHPRCEQCWRRERSRERSRVCVSRARGHQTAHQRQLDSECCKVGRGSQHACDVCARSIVEHSRKGKVIREELAWWDVFLRQAMTDGQLIVAWKTFPRFSPQVFDVENLIAIRIIGCGLTGLAALNGLNTHLIHICTHAHV
jgi:hypothetical protein